jgi:large subunit ribosomal protein L15
MCNNDPTILDAAYVRILGKDGDRVLSDEVKWLAVTHKSFDQGRRGFNDRLSYLGESLIPAADVFDNRRHKWGTLLISICVT